MTYKKMVATKFYYDRNGRRIGDGDVVTFIPLKADYPISGTARKEEEWVVYPRNTYGELPSCLPLEKVKRTAVVVAHDAGDTPISSCNQQRVFRQIEDERRYQDEKWGGVKDNPHTPIEWVTIMRGELEEAREAWLDGDGMLTYHKVMNEVLQATAVGVAALEQHATLSRQGFEYMIEGIGRSMMYRDSTKEALLPGLSLEEYAWCCKAEIILRTGMDLEEVKEEWPDRVLAPYQDEQFTPAEAAEHEIEKQDGKTL